MQSGILGHFMHRVITSMDTVRSGSEKRATKALAVIAKLIQWINLYEQMLEHHRVLKVARDDVAAAFREVAGTEVERAAFTAAERAFLASLKKKTELLADAEDTQKRLEEDLAREKINHDTNMLTLNRLRPNWLRSWLGRKPKLPSWRRKI